MDGSWVRAGRDPAQATAGSAAGGAGAPVHQRAGAHDSAGRGRDNAAMTRPTPHLLRIFVTGLLAALPLAATVLVFWWAASILLQWLGPQSAIGRGLSRIGLGVTGSEIAGYAIGVAIVAAAVFGLGLIVQTRLQRGLQRLVDAVLSRIPLVRNVYETAQKVVGLFAQRDSEGLKQMSAVWCHFGGPPSDPADPGRVAVLALLSTPQPVTIGGRPYVGVIVPTAPVPVGGGLLYLPQDWVTPAEIGIEALTSIYVSMGITSAQHLARAGTAPTASVAPAGTAVPATVERAGAAPPARG
jgi:uncharacterized membrane protein